MQKRRQHQLQASMSVWRAVTQDHKAELVKDHLAQVHSARNSASKCFFGWAAEAHRKLQAREHVALALRHWAAVTAAKAISAWHALTAYMAELRRHAAGPCEST